MPSGLEGDKNAYMYINFNQVKHDCLYC